MNRATVAAGPADVRGIRLENNLPDLIGIMEEMQKRGNENAPKPGGGEAGQKNGGRSFWKRPPVIVVCVLILCGAFYLGLHYVIESFTHESTDDAFLDGNVVSVAPQASGRVKKIYVLDNQPVKSGDPLVDIEGSDYEVQLSQKKAARVSAEANVSLIETSVALLEAEVTTAKATAKQSAAEADADQANSDKAEADLKRAESLIQDKTISPQEYDAAKAAAASAIATLKAGHEKAASDETKIAVAEAQLVSGRQAWERARAQEKQAAVDVQQADLNLSYTHLVAPEDGRITRKAVEVGDYVQVGQRLMALVPAQVWVTANFKETQLNNIRPGQPVSIAVDALGGRVLAGHVQSIQAGSGAAFSLLPPENAVGNYVKVVQRVPVKITFDSTAGLDSTLGPGMSVVPFVQIASFNIPDFAVVIAAVLMGAVVGVLWWRAAMRNAPAEKSQ